MCVWPISELVGEGQFVRRPIPVSFFPVVLRCLFCFRWLMGGSILGAQGARAPSKPMTGRSGLIDSVLLALPVRFQNMR